MRAIAEKYGEVRDVYIPRDFFTKRPKGLAFVEFTEASDCQAACDDMEGMDVEGQPVRFLILCLPASSRLSVSSLIVAAEIPKNANLTCRGPAVSRLVIHHHASIPDLFIVSAHLGGALGRVTLAATATHNQLAPGSASASSDR